ncbi:HET-domain-containing protein [Xylariaceae sp. FL0016]|nr:HET-domain-containing protein [Xylariaceae sp. FL0016]
MAILSVCSNLADVLTTELVSPCSYCRMLVPDRKKPGTHGVRGPPTQYERLDKYPTYPGLKASAEAGCAVCALLRYGLRQLPDEVIKSAEKNTAPLVWFPYSNQVTRLVDGAWDREVRLSADFESIEHNENPSSDVDVAESSSQSGVTLTTLWIAHVPTNGPLRTQDGGFWGADAIDFPVFDSPDLLSPNLEYRRRLPRSSTLSHENIEMIEHWIQDCKENHPECASTPEPWIPARLLELSETTMGTKIRLVETTDEHLRLRIKFAALSHVWGDFSIVPRPAWLDSKHEDLLKGIVEEDMPKNWVDAVHVCLKLGLKYIWVDCPCIKQHNEDDWREQSSLMHLVYRNAEVTFIATSAESCHDGFTSRDLDRVPAIKVPYSTAENAEEDSSDHFMVLCSSGIPQSSQRLFAINRSRWNTRAWTMQERSLSTRMVHFCRNKLFYECRGCLKSEENEPTQEMELISRTLWPRGASFSFDVLYEYWQLLLREYTSRNLTQCTDKLVAIQSVAQEMAMVTGKEYIRFAGMFRHNLHNELLWLVSFGRPSRPPEWCGPSWSWASVEGEVCIWVRLFRSSLQAPPDSLLRRLSSHRLEVLELDEDWPDPEGRTPGFITLRTLTKRIDAIERNSHDFFKHDLLSSMSVNRENTKNGLTLVARARFDFDDPEVDLGHGNEYLYAHVNNEARYTGLLLQEVSSHQGIVPLVGERIWRRVGLATLFQDRSAVPIQERSFLNHETPVNLKLI